MKDERKLRKIKVLVTGGAGFIGSHCVGVLLNSGLKVCVVDNLSTGEKERLDCTHPNLEFIQGDILDYTTIKNAVLSVSHVIHLAAQTSVNYSIKYPLESFKTNVFGFVNLLHAIKEINPKIRTVYASSAAVYGDNIQLPCNEIIEKNNIFLSPYALDKAQDEDHAILYNKLYGLDLLGLRFFNVYGPKQNPDSSYSGVVTKFIHAALNNNPLHIYGDGNQTRDFIFVEDAAMAIYKALFSNFQGILNIARGKSVSLKELIIFIENILGEKLRVFFQPERVGDIKHSLADVSKAQEAIKFSAKTNVEEGLQKLITWLTQNNPVSVL